MNENDTTKPSETNWARFDEMTDEMIDTSEIPPLSDDFFEKATWRMPKQSAKVTVEKVTVEKVTVEIEPDVLDWFKAQGDDYQQRLTAALRLYAEAHRQVGGEYQTG